MPRDYKMTWIDGRKAWKKIHDGEPYFVSVRQLSRHFGVFIPPTKTESYQWANRWWTEVKLPELNAARYRRPPLPGERLAALALGKQDGLLDPEDVRVILEAEKEQLQRDLDNLVWDNREDTESSLEKAIRVLNHRVLYPYAMGEAEALAPEARDRAEVRQLASAVRGGDAADPGQSVSHWVEKFLEKKKDDLSYGKWKECRIHMADLTEHLGAGSDARTIDAATVDGYVARLKQSDRSKRYLGERHRFFKEFVHWLVIREVLPHDPKNLRDRVRLQKATPPPKHWTLEEIQLALKVASERMKTYLLPALNGAWTQVEIATLAESEVDWGTGIVTKGRHKTKHYERRVIVSYRLWPVTLEMLRRHRSGQETVLLSKRSKTPLWKEGSVDRIGDDFKVLRERMRKEPGFETFNRSFGQLRKTAGRLVEIQYRSKDLSNFFLAHVDDRINATNYTGDDTLQDQLYEATDWLGRRLGLLPPTPAE
jgi:hypothetical protein